MTAAAVDPQSARAPKERPILFSGPMIRALLSGAKTQTRRVIAKPETYARLRDCAYLCPHGQAGDKLWVRETWGDADCMYQGHANDEPGTVAYFADKSAIQNAWSKQPRQVPAYDIASWNWDSIKKRPSIFMPRWASRITLEVTEVRVEQLHEITEADAKAEGALFHNGHGVGHTGWRHDINHGYVYETARESFAVLWQQINGKRAGCAWEANPWLWVVSFRKVTP